MTNSLSRFDVDLIARRVLFAKAAPGPVPPCAIPVPGSTFPINYTTPKDYEWASKLSEDQRQAVAAWQSNNYQYIREYQQFGETIEAQAKKWTKDLGSAWKKAPKHTKGTVYRGVQLTKEQAKGFSFGEIEFENFTATSLDKSIARNFATKNVGERQPCIFEIRQSKTGRRILGAGREDEAEVLFGAGAEFDISYDGVENGVWRFILTEIIR